MNFFTWGLISLIVMGPLSIIIAFIVTIVRAPFIVRKEIKRCDEEFSSYMSSCTPTTPAEHEETQEPEYTEVDEDLEFRQLFKVGADMCLLVNEVVMCPDETALIRVVDDEGYTPIYKRKVRRDKAGNRFIVFNSTNYYLDDTKTQPVVQKGGAK